MKKRHRHFILETTAGAVRRRGAFSVLEIVFVLATVAAIVALLNPTFSAVRKRESQIQSLSNLRQWGIAINLSLPDNRNTLPVLGAKSDGSPDLDNPDAWFNRLPLYLSQKPLSDLVAVGVPPRLGDTSIWINPGVSENEALQLNLGESEPLFTYAMNAWLKPSKGKKLRITRIDNPSATVFLGEVVGREPIFTHGEIKSFYGKAKTHDAPESSAHLLFCDGHVELVPRSRFDPAHGAPSTRDDPPSAELTFVPFEGVEK